jgi:hypothetical protein
MGAGKSTTAWFLHDYLRQNGHDSQFMPEGPTANRRQHPLRVGTTLPHPQAVWRDTTVTAYVDRSIALWQAFVAETRAGTAVTVCDGLLFHGNLTDLMLMDAEPDLLHRYVAAVEAAIRPLRPCVVYLHHADVRRALRTVCDARGPTWEAYQVGWKVASPYAIRRSLAGFDGLVRLYEDYRAVCDAILAALPIPKLALRNEGDWEHYRAAILAFLQFPPQPDTTQATNAPA